MVAVDDWFPFKIGRYDRDTLHLDPYQDGLYFRLLRWYYANREPLPDNDAALANICRIAPGMWAIHAPVLRAFFTSKAGKLHQKRADTELAVQDGRGKGRVKQAQKAANARWNKNKGLDAASNAQAMHENAQALLGDATKKESLQVASKAPLPSSDTENSDLLLRPEASIAASSNLNGHAHQAGKASRLAIGWTLPPDWRDLAADRRRHHGLPAINLDLAGEQFANHWHGKSGKDGAKLNWRATWVNWALRTEPPRSQANTVDADHARRIIDQTLKEKP